MIPPDIRGSKSAGAPATTRVTVTDVRHNAGVGIAGIETESGKYADTFTVHPVDGDPVEVQTLDRRSEAQAAEFYRLGSLSRPDRNPRPQARSSSSQRTGSTALGTFGSDRFPLVVARSDGANGSDVLRGTRR